MSDKGGEKQTMKHSCQLISDLWHGYGNPIKDIFWVEGCWWASNGSGATEIQYCPWCGVCLNKLLMREDQLLDMSNDQRRI